MSVAGTLSQHARRTPDRVAVVCDGARVTWRELDRAVLRIASHLAATVPAGRGVALHLPNGPALVVLFLGACRAGREAQILDPGWPAAMARLSMHCRRGLSSPRMRACPARRRRCG